MLHLVYTMYLFIIYNFLFQTIYTESFQWQFFLWDICGIFLHYSLDGKRFFLSLVRWQEIFLDSVRYFLSLDGSRFVLSLHGKRFSLYLDGNKISKRWLPKVKIFTPPKLSNLLKSSWKRNCTRKCCSTFIRGQDGLVWREKVGETFRGLVP